MKNLLYKLGQYLTLRFAPPTVNHCKCHLDYRACPVHFKGDLQFEIKRMFAGDEFGENFYRGWIEFIASKPAKVEIITITIDGSVLCRFPVTTLEELQTAGRVIGRSAHRIISGMDISQRNWIQIFTKEKP